MYAFQVMLSECIYQYAWSWKKTNIFILNKFYGAYRFHSSDIQNSHDFWILSVFDWKMVFL